MKKILLLTTFLFFLTGCSQYSAMLAPSITLVETGNVLQASSAYGKSYTLGYARQNVSEELSAERICETHYSSDLYKIFFETQDRDNCIFDPMSIYR